MLDRKIAVPTGNDDGGREVVHLPEDGTRWELFEPDPEPVAPTVTVISVDDHVVEPPWVFHGRVPRQLAADAPRIVEKPDGRQVWRYEGNELFIIGVSAVAGRTRDLADDQPFSVEPARFDEMRPGCYDIEPRIHDMDLNGVWASLNFPSMITGFCGRNLFSARSKELGVACIRAYNDWMYEEWYLAHPDRIIPLGVVYLPDPELAVAEIHRLASLGFKSVSLPERPHHIGLPSLWDKDHWGPILHSCVETGLVCSIHVGSSGSYAVAPDCPFDNISAGLSSALFGQLSLAACAEWLFSGWPLRLPDLELALSEGGIGWVPMLLDRLDNMVDRSGYGRGWQERPSDVLRRNFSFCTLDDPSTIDCRERIGIGNIMVEVDYPHGDSTWPVTQQTIRECWGHIPAPELRRLCSENAAALYSHPLPAVVLPISGS
jgi:predicted TIM-barrel fold metal-dependent hydrolase